MRFQLVFLCVLSVLIEQSSQQHFSCGVSRRVITELIVGGRITQAQDWPWHALIFHPGSTGSAEYACGGTLISDRFVLTARHCTYENGKRLVGSAIVVQFGVQQLYDWNPESYQQHAVFKIHLVPRHEQWRNLRNDIALLELKTLVVFTDYVLPACLPDRDLTEGELGTAIGFGFSESRTLSQTLREAQMPVVNTGTCVRSSRIAISAVIDEAMVCAGLTNGTTVCNGDSGGGLLFQRKDSWQLGAVVSFAEKHGNRSVNSCKHDGYGVFVNVFQYLPWIAEIADIEVFVTYEATPVPIMTAEYSTKFKDCRWLEWTPDKGPPPDGVIVGNDTDGNQVFIGRAFFGGDLITGNFHPSSGTMFISWLRKGRSVVNFEVLTGHGFRWVKDHGGHVPQNAVAGGRTERGDTMYVGRHASGVVWNTGPVVPFKENIILAGAKAELIYADYEVLVHDDPLCQKW